MRILELSCGTTPLQLVRPHLIQYYNALGVVAWPSALVGAEAQVIGTRYRNPGGSVSKLDSVVPMRSSFIWQWAQDEFLVLPPMSHEFSHGGVAIAYEHGRVSLKQHGQPLLDFDLSTGSPRLPRHVDLEKVAAASGLRELFELFKLPEKIPMRVA